MGDPGAMRDPRVEPSADRRGDDAFDPPPLPSTELAAVRMGERSGERNGERDIGDVDFSAREPTRDIGEAAWGMVGVISARKESPRIGDDTGVSMRFESSLQIEAGFIESGLNIVGDLDGHVSPCHV